MIPGQQVPKRSNNNKKNKNKEGGSGKTMKRKRSNSNRSQGGGMNYEQLLKHRENRTAQKEKQQ